MAKISARGAKEVGRRRIGDVTWVATSDGRILSKVHYSHGGSSSYGLRGKIKKGLDVVEAFNRIMDKKEAFHNAVVHRVAMGAPEVNLPTGGEA